MSIKPKARAPELAVPTVDGDIWRLDEQTPRAFTMLVFYRGLHCPVCKGYLADLERKLPRFAERGVEVSAISADDETRAAQAKAEWGLQHLRVGYGLPIDKAREWGLYISSAIKDNEPARFTEPGLFLIEPGGSLYYAAINSMPFGRPSFSDLLGAIDFVQTHHYPARGEA